MIILDTNVISEAMRGPQADSGVLAWLRALPAPPVTTVINRAEILAGIALLPAGARAERLRESAERAFGTLGVCLPLTAECCAHYGDIVATRQRAGRPIGGMDALIAAIAREASATVATRDVDGFSDLGLDLVNPWSA
ncbi:MAG: type II toxin-antitoxin system VapC family toxin [Acidimicrobiales bacterium]